MLPFAAGPQPGVQDPWCAPLTSDLVRASMPWMAAAVMMMMMMMMMMQGDGDRRRRAA